jgi:hypothetical protein
MATTADIVVNDAQETPQLIVEAKRRVPASREWAAKMRRNMFAHMVLPRTPFFLLALPERFFLWKNAPPMETTPPDYEIDTQQVLQPYLAKLQTSLSALSENGFELLIRSWLEDVVNSPPDSARLGQANRWLVESGLYEAIRQGSIKAEVPV